MDQISSRLTIFEGPDGSGKSTAAKAFAQATGARYVHFAALPHVSKNLARMYVEAMLPAVLGYQSVVFDRCWLSEIPYGAAFRNGDNRLNTASCRMLERLAMRCGAVVVKCLPAWEVVKTNYLGRKHLEMLDNEQQLQIVYDLYLNLVTSLPCVNYDYTVDTTFFALNSVIIELMRMPRHSAALASAGNLNARVVLVGKSFGEQKDNDPFYQWPFASFSHRGCSQWLTTELATGGVSESELFWLNADQPLAVLHELSPDYIVALGNVAYQQLCEHKIEAVEIQHPQYWKRFDSAGRYPLLDLI